MNLHNMHLTIHDPFKGAYYSKLYYPKRAIALNSMESKQKRYEYPVIDLSSGNNQEKILTVGKRTSEDIDTFISEFRLH